MKLHFHLSLFHLALSFLFRPTLLGISNTISLVVSYFTESSENTYQLHTIIQSNCYPHFCQDLSYLKQAPNIRMHQDRNPTFSRIII